MKNQPDNHPESPPPEKHRETPKTAYGKAIEHYRTRLELSQEDFSEACGLGKNAIGEYETGKRKKPQRDTIKRIVGGICAQGLEITIEEFDAKVAEYETPANGTLNYTDPHYQLDTTKGKQDLAELTKHIPSAHKIIAQIARSNSEMRFVRGITNTLNRFEKMAGPNHPFELETFCTLMKQFDSFVQEIERKNLKDAEDIFSLKSLREKLDGFEDELGKFYPEYKDGLIPNDWPGKDIRHQNLIDGLFGEIQQRKFKVEDIEDIEFRTRALDTLEELEIELDRNPLHLKNINTIRARLEELDRNIFKELLITSQLLLGTYADQLPPGSVFRDIREAPEMVVIPAGEFLMGSAGGEGHDSECLQHKVTIPYLFAVGRYPVTFEEWDCYRQYHPEAHNPNDQGWGRDRRPVINISWDNTKGFLEWLEGQTKMPYRLLSEAQWEYACRAGEETQYHFGDDEAQLEEYAWYNKNADGKTQPVGQKKPNQYGLYDMHGNVYEWCKEHYHDNYTGAPSDGSAWIDADDKNTSSHVFRGGSWLNDPRFLRARFREWGLRVNLYYDVGFRVARALTSR